MILHIFTKLSLIKSLHSYFNAFIKARKLKFNHNNNFNPGRLSKCQSIVVSLLNFLTFIHFSLWVMHQRGIHALMPAMEMPPPPSSQPFPLWSGISPNKFLFSLKLTNENLINTCGSFPAIEIFGSDRSACAVGMNDTITMIYYRIFSISLSVF